MDNMPAASRTQLCRYRQNFRNRFGQVACAYLRASRKEKDEVGNAWLAIEVSHQAGRNVMCAILTH